MCFVKCFKFANKLVTVVVRADILNKLLFSSCNDMFAHSESFGSQPCCWYVSVIADLEASGKAVTVKRIVSGQLDGQLNRFVALPIIAITNGCTVAEPGHIVQNAATLFDKNTRFALHFAIFARVSSKRNFRFWKIRLISYLYLLTGSKRDFLRPRRRTVVGELELYGSYQMHRKSLAL